MKKIVETLLKTSAKMSERIAIKSCGATSLYDTYQPKVPEAVKELAKKNKK
ncbi:MAG: cyclic lactone autoinducer peptide [Ruminococcus sp.]|nr:cyclic lactone autoinducer peptide [Ruminococcus sp.]